MKWNEKIDLIKKEYSNDNFFVPNLNRKKILKKIESKFIKRDKGYYDLNNSNERFTAWWGNLNPTEEKLIFNDLESTLNYFIKVNTNKDYWIGCEFSNQILIYKSKIQPIIRLISIGISKTNIFHIIGVKYDFCLSLKIEQDTIKVKMIDNL